MVINQVQFKKFEIPQAKVLARLGFANGKTKIDHKIKEIFDEELATAKKLLSPKQVVASSPLRFSGPKTALLEPCFVIESSGIARLLRDCSEAAGFAVTIGPALEALRDKYLKDRETTRALVLDAAGSVAAEELAEITNAQIRNEASKRGLAATRRFSPGYGDWQLSCQKDFLAWLGAGQAGIKVTETFQMLPEKSVSAILGLKNENREHNG